MGNIGHVQVVVEGDWIHDNNPYTKKEFDDIFLLYIGVELVHIIIIFYTDANAKTPVFEIMFSKVIYTRDTSYINSKLKLTSWLILNQFHCVKHWTFFICIFIFLRLILTFKTSPNHWRRRRHCHRRHI